VAALTAHGLCEVPVTIAAAFVPGSTWGVPVGQPSAVPTVSTGSHPLPRTSANCSSTGYGAQVTRGPQASANSSSRSEAAQFSPCLDYKELIAAGSSLDYAADKDWPCVRIFFGFSGPAGRTDGFEVWARRAGIAAKLNVSVFIAGFSNFASSWTALVV